MLEPGEMQTMLSFTFLPWSVKIIYGLISDNFPLFGSRRKSYILIMALLQFLSMIVLGFTNAEDLPVSAATWMLFISNLGIAFSDVIVDSLMVIQSRRFPDDGCEDLTAFSWTCSAIGGLSGSIASAFVMEYYEPRYSFMFESVMGFIIAIVALRMNVSLETDGQTKVDGSKQGSFWSDLKRNCSEIKEAFQVKAYYRTILYLVFTGLLVPGFGSFDYYFMIDVVGISDSTLALLGVLGYACSLLGTQLFNSYFKDWEYQSLIKLDAVIGLTLAPLSMLFVLRLNEGLGIPNMALIIFTSQVSSILGECLVFLPMSVIMGKICPQHIEATSFALLAGISNMRAEISSFTGTWINERFIGCTKSDLSNYWKLATIEIVCSWLPLFFIWLIPTRKSIEDLQSNEKDR